MVCSKRCFFNMQEYFSGGKLCRKPNIRGRLVECVCHGRGKSSTGKLLSSAVHFKNVCRFMEKRECSRRKGSCCWWQLSFLQKTTGWWQPGVKVMAWEEVFFIIAELKWEICSRLEQDPHPHGNPAQSCWGDLRDVEGTKEHPFKSAFPLPEPSDFYSIPIAPPPIW